MGREMGRTLATAMTIPKTITLLAITCMAVITACSKAEQPYSLLDDDTVLRPGDLLFRRGTAMTSHAVAMADKNGAFSHVGIVADSSGVMVVVHAVPDEPDFEGDPDCVKMEEVHDFFSTERATYGEICRPSDSVTAVKASQAAMAIYRQKPLFDHQYNSEDTTQMYCTELVMEAYKRAGCTLTGPPTHSYTFLGIHCMVWLPSDLYKSPHIRCIKVLKPKKQ